jgi:hypothetical protein
MNTTINETAILRASYCPICWKAPVMLVDNAVWPTYDKTKDYIVCCSSGCPFPATGDNPDMAVDNWNKVVSFRQKDFHHNQGNQDPRTTHLTYCPHCQTFTASKLTFGEHKSTAQCEACYLIKSVKELE